VVTLEEGCIMGGFGTAVMEALMDHDVMVPVKRLGVPDILVEHAKPDEAKAELGLTGSQIATKVRELFFSQQLSTVSS
jgi:1-deoxy-D-xylulose-5-phosphate synthase